MNSSCLVSEDPKQGGANSPQEANTANVTHETSMESLLNKRYLPGADRGSSANLEKTTKCRRIAF